MKKIIFLTAIAMVLFSCKSGSVANTQLDKAAQIAVKGDWVLSAVNYPGSKYIKVNTFQVADSKCFVGSKWKFISNNNKGTMTLNNSECAAFSSPITWYVNKEGKFVLKVLDAGEKAKNTRQGYILAIANQAENSFQLIDKGDVEGKAIDVIYQFVRAN